MTTTTAARVSVAALRPSSGPDTREVSASGAPIAVTPEHGGIIRASWGDVTLAERPRAPKLAESAAETFAPDTGDAALDAFMMRSRARTGPPKPPRATPAPRFPFGLRAMNKTQTREVAEFNVAAAQAWQRLGYRVVTVDTPGEQFPGAHALDWRNVRVIAPDASTSDAAVSA